MGEGHKVPPATFAMVMHPADGNRKEWYETYYCTDVGWGQYTPI